MSEVRKELSKVAFKQQSHMSFTNKYVNLMMGEYNGQKIFMHSITKRKNEFELGKSRIFFSLTLNGNEMTTEELIKHFESLTSE